MVYVLARGKRVQFEDLHFIFYYAGAFIVAGAIVGLLWPMRITTVGRYALGIIGAGIGMTIMMVGLTGSIARWSGAEWFSGIFCTIFFGVLLAREIEHV